MDDTNEYISDLNRLTHNPADEVRLTKTSYKTITRALDIVEQSLDRIEEQEKYLRKERNTLRDRISDIHQIINSIKPKVKSKFGTKENLIPDIRFISSWEKYEEALNAAPKVSLTPVPDLNEVLSKIQSAITA